MSLLPDDTIAAIVENPDSPQNKAFEWLISDTDYHPLLSESRIRQRFALATFYFSTDGPQWLFQDHWLNHTRHECEWTMSHGPNNTNDALLASVQGDAGGDA